jgi:hypothetical protein
MSVDPWVLVAAIATVTVAIKAVGPVLLGGGTLPPRAAAVVALLAPALLAALVVTGVASHDGRLRLGPEAVGVAAGGLAGLRGWPILACVIVAAVVTAALRAVV